MAIGREAAEIDGKALVLKFSAKESPATMRELLSGRMTVAWSTARKRVQGSPTLRALGMTMIMRMIATLAVLVTMTANVPAPVAQGREAVITGPVGPSPYDVVRGWHKPFAEPGFAFGGNSGVFAESPNRIFVAQRGETRLPNWSSWLRPWLSELSFCKN